jgi:hypothetical protein
MDQQSSSTGPPALVCATCGERLVRGRATGTFSHVARLVAACDLDSDHLPEPDWSTVGDLPCRACGEPTAPTEGGFQHRDHTLDANHLADPVLPLV